MKTKKNYVSPKCLVEEFVANEYVASCVPQFIYTSTPDVLDANKYPSNTKFYVDGLKYGGSYGNSGMFTDECNGILDNNEKTKHVTTNASGSTGKYDGIRKAWLVDGEVEIELGMMQNQGQWAAYKKGTLVKTQNFS